MNYIKHLTGFFDKVAKDKTLNPTHISLYIALFQFWNCNRFKNPLSISRDEVMRISKISSKATYHKCIRNLHDENYLKYEPSYNPFRGSHVYMFNFSDDLKPLPKHEKTAGPKFEHALRQVPDNLRTGTETSSEQVIEQVLVPSLNNINNTNILNSSNGSNLRERNHGEIDVQQNLYKISKEKKLREKENADISLPPPPTLAEVISYFDQNDFPEIEANKFFNYFKSIGWLVGGKTPMADWKAAVQNWMLNARKFTAHETIEGSRSFNSSSLKNYSEPL